MDTLMFGNWIIRHPWISLAILILIIVAASANNSPSGSSSSGTTTSPSGPPALSQPPANVDTRNGLPAPPNPAPAVLPDPLPDDGSSRNTIGGAQAPQNSQNDLDAYFQMRQLEDAQRRQRIETENQAKLEQWQAQVDRIQQDYLDKQREAGGGFVPTPVYPAAPILRTQ